MVLRSSNMGNLLEYKEEGKLVGNKRIIRLRHRPHEAGAASIAQQAFWVGDRGQGMDCSVRSCKKHASAERYLICDSGMRRSRRSHYYYGGP